jgi:glucose dehydrogenase
LAVSAACKTIAGTSSSAIPLPGSWPDPNADLANTRVAPGSSISSANVSKLTPAWSFKIAEIAAAGVGASGSLAANPIVQGGGVYVQDLDANVYALSLASGQLEWEYVCDAPEKTGPGPSGVAVVGGRVYGATNTAVFALNAATGKPDWVNSGVLAKGQGTFGIQPQVSDGRVYLASPYAIGPGGGVLVALNTSTGAVLWKFNTVTGPDPGVESLGLGSGGAWETPLVGTDGSVTYGIGNQCQSMESAIAHPAAQLYTHSDVKLDAATGKLRWYYQGVPNDFKDYDMQASPISAVAGGVPVVIGSGKMGYVYEMNAGTRQADLADAGRRAERHRGRLAQAARASHRAEGAVRHRSRITGRRAHQPSACRRHRLRSHAQRATCLHEPESALGGEARRPGRGQRGGGGAKRRDRQGRVGHEAQVRAARRRDRLE